MKRSGDETTFLTAAVWLLTLLMFFSPSVHWTIAEDAAFAGLAAKATRLVRPRSAPSGSAGVVPEKNSGEPEVTAPSSRPSIGGASDRVIPAWSEVCENHLELEFATPGTQIRFSGSTHPARRWLRSRNHLGELRIFLLPAMAGTALPRSFFLLQAFVISWGIHSTNFSGCSHPLSLPCAPASGRRDPSRELIGPCGPALLLSVGLQTEETAEPKELPALLTCSILFLLPYEWLDLPLLPHHSTSFQLGRL